MNGIDFDSGEHFCGREPALGTTRCETLHCQAPAEYLCRAIGVGELQFTFTRRLCMPCAAVWCLDHAVVLPPHNVALIYQKSDRATIVDLLDDVAQRFYAVLDAAPDRLRDEWTTDADQFGEHWLRIAVADVTAWPVADGGLDCPDLAPAHLDALIGAVCALRTKAFNAATSDSSPHNY